MKACDVVGYTADGEAWCPAGTAARYGPAHPTRDQRDRDGNAVHPVFAADEWTYEPVCGACGASLPARVVHVRRSR